MVEADGTLRKLSEKVSKLNKSSDEINELISAYEEKLAEMKIGVEVWIDDPDYWVFHPDDRFTLRVYNREIKEEYKEWTAAFLGYAKINNQWCIAVRKARIVDDGEKQDIETLRILPLTEAQRESRINALGSIDRLFKAIEVRVDEMLSSIEKGKKFIKSIE